MRVSEVARELGVPPDTIRYYTRIGYVTPHRNRTNGYNEYNETQRKRLRFVLRARQLGFSVADIGEILREAENGKSPCPLVRRLIDERLHETEQSHVEMVALRDRMKRAVADWSAKPDGEPTGDSICHLIEGFDLESEA